MSDKGGTSKINDWKMSLTGPALPPVFEFRPLVSWPKAVHPHQDRIDAQKAIPSLVK